MKTMSDHISCVDTNVLIWGILQEGITEKEKEMIPKAKEFLKSEFDQGKTLAISIITLAEFMVAIPEKKRNQIHSLFLENFIILPFDYDAAIKAAEIFYQQYHTMKSSYVNQRAIIRQDIQILASALMHDNVTLTTEDGPFMTLAEKYLQVQKIPIPASTQLALFTEEDDLSFQDPNKCN